MKRLPPAFVPEYPRPFHSVDDVVDRRVARVALADVVAGVGAAGRVRMVELPLVVEPNA